MKSDYTGYDIKQLRESLKTEKVPALRDAGLLTSQAIDYLSDYSESYQPNQARHYEDETKGAYFYYNSETYVDIVSREVSKQLSAAVKQGNSSVIAHAQGLGSKSKPTMDFVEYERLAQLIESPSQLLLLFGDTGSGKTFSAVRLAELWTMRVGGTILTNVQSLAEANDNVQYVDNYVELLTYCINNPKERKLFLADELSSLMSGYSSDRSDVEKYMRPLVRKMRKEPFRMSIIGIGHRPTDIHPTLRNGELSIFGFKEGETKEKARKKLAIYEDLVADKPKNKLVDVSGIGLPSMTIDTNDNGNWGWGTEADILAAAHDLKSAGYGDMLKIISNLGDDEPNVPTDEEENEENEKLEDEYRKIHENGASYREISELTGTPKSTVSLMVNRSKERVD